MLPKNIDDAIKSLVAEMVIESNPKNAANLLVDTKNAIASLYVATLDKRVREATRKEPAS